MGNGRKVSELTLAMRKARALRRALMPSPAFGVCSCLALGTKEHMSLPDCTATRYCILDPSIALQQAILLCDSPVCRPSAPFPSLRPAPQHDNAPTAYSRCWLAGGSPSFPNKPRSPSLSDRRAVNAGPALGIPPGASPPSDFERTRIVFFDSLSPALSQAIPSASPAYLRQPNVSSNPVQSGCRCLNGANVQLTLIEGFAPFSLLAYSKPRRKPTSKGKPRRQRQVEELFRHGIAASGILNDTATQRRLDN